VVVFLVIITLFRLADNRPARYKTRT